MEKIKKLRKIFKDEKIEGYLVPKNDEFFSEYTSKNNDRLKYISNFSGSYGYCLILKNKNYLFVDGRYTLQASKQCGKYFKVITFPGKMPFEVLKNKEILIGFDPKLITNKNLKIFFGKSKCKFKPLNINLIDRVWGRKVINNKSKFYFLRNKEIGSNYKIKLTRLVTFLKKKSADYQFITASENNAWLLNIRGDDEEYTPVPHSHLLINKNGDIKFFCNTNKISKSFKNQFKEIQFLDFNTIKKNLSNIYKKKFVIDKNTCSYFFENIIKKNNKILNLDDPIYYFKSLKNKQEIKNIKLAHIYDGVALTKYLFWLKNNISKKKITEISGAQKLFEFRKKNKKFKFSSFPTISGSGPNGAIIHYKASKKTNRVLKLGEVYLVDSGGQYEFGTTDVTRTISLKSTNKRIKNIFTRVLKGHIAVANFKLKNKTNGSMIDIQGRKYLRQIGLDYPHGTGHGVGYFLNVHEGPQSITKNNKIKLEEGMVISNEPGYYEKNKFGIRIENLIFIKKYKKKKYFENLTMVPIDKDMIDRKILNMRERKWLNKYHKKVYENLSDKMDKNEISQLKQACSAI